MVSEFPAMQLEPEEKKFSLVNARACAQFCKLAYSRATISNAHTDTQLLIWENPDCVVVAFRGTSDLADALTDLKVRRERTKFDDMQIHRGFEIAFSSVMDDAFVDLMGRSGKPIFFTGHSLGGALAMIAAHFFFRAHGVISQVYTFGQPRVGDSGFAKKYNASLHDTTFRVCNQDDPVPMVPPITLGYRAAGQLIFLPRECGIRINPSFWTVAVINAVGAANAWQHGHLALLPNHAVDLYIAKLNAIGK